MQNSFKWFRGVREKIFTSVVKLFKDSYDDKIKEQPGKRDLSDDNQQPETKAETVLLQPTEADYQMWLSRQTTGGRSEEKLWNDFIAEMASKK